MSRRLFIASLAALLCSSRAFATVPRELSLQGVLRDGAGALQTSTAAVSVTFWSAQTAGSQLGATIGPATVMVTNGLFTMPLPLAVADLGALSGSGEVWVEVTAGSDTFPRSKVEPELYAQLAGVADGLSASCVGCVTDAQLAGNISASKINGAVTSAANFSGSLSGDVTGLQSATVVAALRGTVVSANAPTLDGQQLVYNQATNQWQPGQVTLGGDVTGSATANTVTRIQGRPVAATLPATGQTLKWSGAGWAPADVISVPLPVASGGTGATTQSFVDLTTNQPGIAGAKGFTANVTVRSGGAGAVQLGDMACGPTLGGVLFGSAAPTGCTNYALAGDGTNLYLNHNAFGVIEFRANNVPQVAISATGMLSVDQGALNNGALGNGSAAAAGLTFGANSGEGIASKRTANPPPGPGVDTHQQFGLDLYTNFTRRLAITSVGNVAVDPEDRNTGGLNGGSEVTSGLTFGKDSGEGIASKRSGAGGGLAGLDFYTAKTRRFFVDNAGGIYRANNSTVWDQISDERLKDIHGAYERGLKELLTLKPIRFNYKHDNALGLESDQKHIGITAQNLQAAIPEAVRTGPQGYLTVNVDPVLWTTVNAVKDEHRELQDLKAQNAELRARLAMLERQVNALVSQSKK